MGAPVNHGRIKPRYDPKPNAAETRHKDRVKRMPCCGCGRRGPSDAHHTLLPVLGKRWRRDHQYLIPVCKDCHQGTNGIHGIGHEGLWCDRVGVDTAAISHRLRAESIELGILPTGADQ